MKERTRLIDPENVAEMARCINWEEVLREVIGGLWPNVIETSPIKMVLDLGCGPGQWATTVAFEHPEIRVIGVDSLRERVQYARECARVQMLANVTFTMMDVLHPPLAFPDGTFDLISGRFLSELLDRASWPQVLVECRRLLRPGGVLCLAEEEVSVSNSLALQQIYRSLYRLRADERHTYAVDRYSVGICPVLPGLLKQAGFCDVASRSFHLDSSAHAPLHLALCQDLEIRLALLKPALLRTGIMEETEYEALHEQIQLDMRNEHFAQMAFGLQVWGSAPARATTSAEAERRELIAL
ncbi:hypothetical protein KSF_087550 [Reticulibacter mediterranei]|uniref:Methyltransferase domain-containing protein n=1 Tax=Reticulibacter mediterranei TaxID=2778369 RepID=A0A8J3N4Y1_9CHLR|nr:class I SAM-dependent methyltransferase [Reticulibacter mediterranei]GHO98707.1 hypothetical protein KSF_087550 [Reticulibacter mediterranei]